MEKKALIFAAAILTGVFLVCAVIYIYLGLGEPPDDFSTKLTAASALCTHYAASDLSEKCNMNSDGKRQVAVASETYCCSGTYPNCTAKLCTT